MTLLIAGLTLWTVVHFFPSLLQEQRAAIITKVGLGTYKGVLAVLIVSSIVLIVYGWRSVIPEDIYSPPIWGRHITFLLMLITFILFVAAKHKTNIKRHLRHPQLTGLVVWSIGHLLANGDNRSVILFVMLGVWAILEMILINRREGVWQKPESLPVKKDIITVIAGCVLYTVLLFAHSYITGMSLMNM